MPTNFYFRNKTIVECLHHLDLNPNISPPDYKDLYPLFFFDVSKQIERVKYSSINIVIRANFKGNVDAYTIAYVAVISDKLIDFQSDENKMSVVY